MIPVRTNAKYPLYWSIASFAIGLVTPSLVIFCLEVFVGRIHPFRSIADILDRQFSEGNNLFLLAIYGLIPFAAMSAASFLAALWLPPRRLSCVAVGGLLGILTVMVPGHVSVWYPLYGPGRGSSTAVLAFILIPFYGIATLCIGLFVGWLVSLLPQFRRANKVVG